MTTKLVDNTTNNTAYPLSQFDEKGVLIFGGTSEGRLAVQVCDEAEKLYYYSTKNSSQQITLANGKRLWGGLNQESMFQFCIEKGIKLIIDAAHPFAEDLHKNIGITASRLDIPIIRFERNFPPYNPKLYWFDNYADSIKFLEENNINNLLALTGVNTISKLKPYWEKNRCTFRIMKRKESLDIVEKSGFPKEHIVFYDDESDDETLFERLKPDAIITKESGDTGGFSEKVAVALKLGLPVLVVRRPSLPYQPAATIYGKYGLRKQIELLLPGFFEQRIGYTTGSCATAATKAALTALLTKGEVNKTSILLPDNEPIELAIYKTEFETDGSVTCTVVKDSGDDPDVTNGAEICSNVALNKTHQEIRFLQGVGVGRVTLPGLGLEIGGPAINSGPRKMMIKTVEDTFREFLPAGFLGVDITISVPKGEELAKRTFNPKLGIVDGISIIGTSGIVKPFSNEAFVNSIRREISVAKALGVERLVINSGAKSERYLKNLYPNLPSQAFVQYGNFIGETLKIAEEHEIKQVTLGIMIGKAVKLASGLLDTHSKKSEMNKAFIQSIAQEAHCSKETIDKIATIRLARELWDLIPNTEREFFNVLLSHCTAVCEPLLSNGKLTTLLIKEDGTIIK